MSATDERQSETQDGIDRRTLIRTVSLASVGMAGVLITSACGGAEEAVSKATDTLKGAIRTADIPVGGGKVFADLGVVVTQPEAGVYKAFSSTCTHKGNPIGSVSDGTINCPFHGSKFDIATGAVKNGPATKALPAKSATVSGGGIQVS